MKLILAGKCIYNLNNIAIITGSYGDQGAEVILHFIHPIDSDKTQSTLQGSEARDFISAFNASKAMDAAQINIDEFCKK